MSDPGPLPIARFRAGAVLRRRTVPLQSHSLHVLRVLAGSLVLDATGLPGGLEGTLGVVQAMVLVGRMEVRVPAGVAVIVGVSACAGGRVNTEVGADRSGPHLLLSGTVLLGSIRVTAGS